MAWAAPLQSTEATRVTSGRSISKQYGSTIIAGSVLVAVVSRSTSTGSPATIGQVSDGTNKWRQANETTVGTSGLDVWICEAPTAGSQPTVTATLNLNPPQAISGMNMWLAEYPGATGFELTDAIGVGAVTTTSLTVTTNHATTAGHDLVLSVISGNMSAASTPSGYTSRLADTTQQFWVADNTDSGASLATQSAAWTGLTGGSAGVALIVALRPTGVGVGSPHLLQSTYYQPAVSTSPFQTSWVGPTLPVNPTVGNTLIALVTGANYDGVLIQAARTERVTDGVGSVWRRIGEQGKDNTGGLDWTIFVCGSAVGGSTQITAYYDMPIQTPAMWLAELAGLPGPLTLDASASSVFTNASSITSPSLLANDVVVSTFGAVFTAQYAPGAGWMVVNSDTIGVGLMQMQMQAAGGAVTASVGPSFGGADFLIAGMKRATGVGAH